MTSHHPNAQAGLELLHSAAFRERAGRDRATGTLPALDRLGTVGRGGFRPAGVSMTSLALESVRDLPEDMRHALVCSDLLAWSRERLARSMGVEEADVTALVTAARTRLVDDVEGRLISRAGMPIASCSAVERTILSRSILESLRPHTSGDGSAIQRAVDALQVEDPRGAAVLALRFFQRLSWAEVEQRTGLEREPARAALARALDRLERLVADAEGCRRS